MIDFKSGARFYDCRSPEPFGIDDSDLRMARKQNLYISITTLLKEMFRNDGLERYAKNQLAMAAYNYPRMEHETLEGYSNRIYQVSLEHSKQAGDFGSAIHAAIDDYPQLPIDQSLIPWINEFAKWSDKTIERVVYSERVMVDHDLGVAGRCDAVCIHKPTGQRFLPDYKTQDIKKDAKGRKKPGLYDSWVRQLMFYAVVDAKEQGTYPQQVPMVMSVVIDSNEPCEPIEKIWTKEECILAYEEVCIASYSYFRSKDFWPHLGVRPSISFSVKQPYQNE